MKPILSILFLAVLAFTACVPRRASAPTAPAITAALPPTETPPGGAPPAAPTPTPAQPPATETAGDALGAAQGGWKTYSDPEFGLSFAYPSGWQGPEPYVSGATLRLEIGSDVVYPYGTGPEERVSTVKNAYFIVIQYTKNETGDFWKETYDALAGLQDGQAASGRRDVLIRVGEVRAGRFKGLEYLSTLSESAQTEPVYTRNVILMDDQNNLLTMMGVPSNVEIGPAGWREAYRQIDEANAPIFHHVLETLSLR